MAFPQREQQIFNNQHIMKKIKMAYEAPIVTCLEIRYEVNVMSGVDATIFVNPSASVDDQSDADWWN